MKTQVVGAVSGLLFGAGLSISGMTDPTRVLGFLDVAGAWDPTLAFVMAGALAVAAIGQWVAKTRAASGSGPPLALPSNARVDGRLLTGAALFGIGWGLAGLCPGPAIAGLATGAPEIALFVGSMIAGMWAFGRGSVAASSRAERAVAG